MKKTTVLLLLQLIKFICIGQLTLPPSTITSNVPEASQYKVVYELNIPNNMTSLVYAQDLSSTTGVSFNRIAYFLQLDSKWVWVSMNKFNSNVTLSQLGLPFGNSSIFFQQTVSGMNVLGSSNAGVTNATNINGNVEIWPHCYGTQLGLGNVNGNANNYDHDDQINANNNCYGSFQVHNYGANQTIFAYNSFNVSGFNDDLGIGNNSGIASNGQSNPDWTFMYNAANYTTKKLYVLVDACSEITINSHPSSSSQNLCLNASALSLSVSAVTNSGTITGYQWYKNTTASYTGATSISGATNSSLSIPTNAIGTNYYFCVVTNSNGCAKYSNISGDINVYNNPSISSHPTTSNLSHCINSVGTALSIAATAGSGTISSYQWYKSTTNSNASGSLISGATMASYTPPTHSVDSGYYFCLVANSNSCATKSNVSGQVKVDALVNKGTVSANQLVCYNSNPVDVAIAAYTGTIQWQRSTDNAIWNNIAGATNATLTAAQNGAISNTTFVRAQLTNGSCSDFSNTVSLEVNNALAFDGINDYVNLGDNIENFIDITTEAWVFWKGSTYPYSEILTKDIISSFSITSDNKLHANFGNGTTWGPGLNSAVNIPLNTWTHLAITRLNGVVKLYINGVEDVNSTTINISGQNNAVRAIGAKINGTLVNSSAFNGHIDEIRVWNVARTAKEIDENQYKLLIGNESGLILYHQFNRGVQSGTNTGVTTSIDKSPSGFNGTLTDFALSGANSNYVSGNNGIRINAPNSRCGGQSISVLSLSKIPNTYQWYTNTTNSTASGTLLSGQSSDQITTSFSLNGNTFYYASTNSCSNAISNTVLISNPVITGTLDVYEDNTTQLACTDAAAASSPWVSLNTSLFTTNNSGLVTGVYPGNGKLVYTTNLGCKDTVDITVHETEWTGNNSNDFATGTNWKLNTKPNVVKKIRFNSNATNNMILTSNMAVDSIDFGTSNKQIELGNNDLIVNHIKNFNSSGYIKTTGTGKVKKQLANNAAFIFPIGKSSYNPVTITNKTGLSDSFSVNVIDTAYLNGSSNGYISNPYVKRTWNISKNTPSANAGSGVDLSFTWNANEVVGTLTNPTLNHHNGSGWEIPSMGTSSLSGTTLTYTGYKGSFSPFAIGGSATVGLPVELLSFEAKCNSEYNQINWTTASEKDNERFELYKSTDAKNWEKIYTVKGQGTKATETQYQYNDLFKKASYYRLKDVDFSGNETWSQIISSECKVENNTTSIYPNPAKDYIEINTPWEENTIYKIVNLSGVVLVEGKLLTNKSKISINELNFGIYIVEIEKTNSIEHIKIIKK